MRRRYNPRLWWIVLGLIIVLTTAAFISFSAMNDDTANGFGGSTFSPIMRFFSNTTKSIQDFFSRLFGLRDVDKEYEDLKEKYDELLIKTEWANEQTKEIERLTKLLGYAETLPDYQMLHANVIGRDTNSWYSYFTIDKGTDHGVSINMAVLTTEGLAGRVVECGENYAKVVTVIATDNAVYAVVERSRDTGVMRGAVDPAVADPLCPLLYMPFDADLVPGDIILTSNLAGVYPKGIAVGEVIEVAQSDLEDVNAYVRPFVDLSRLEDVLIVLGETEQDIYRPEVEDITDDIVNLPSSEDDN